MKIVSRRWVVSAAAAFAAVGLGIWSATHRPEPTLISSTCEGTDIVRKKILVAYATRTASTGEVAEAIALRLCDTGFDAEVRPVADVTALDGYDGAVLGSAIRFAAWLPEMVGFL